MTVNSHGGPKIRRTVVIEDAESLQLECTFWDSWALMWNEYENRLEEIGHLDFLLMLGKIKYWDNKPAVHNALFGSKIYINRKIPQLLSFRERYESQDGYDASQFKIQLRAPGMHVVTPAEFMQGCVKRLVGMIRTIEPGTCCVVYASVHSIQYESGWVYTGCKQCNTKVTPIAAKTGMNSRNKKQLWFCKRHGETYAVSCRFKIIVRILDSSGTAQVVLFDNNVHKMTKLTAWEIMQEQGTNTDDYFPVDLNQIVGREYLFKIKYTEFNHSNNSHVYRAEKVTDDVETINYFKNGFLDEEDNEEDIDNGEDYYDDSGDDVENSEVGSENRDDDIENSDDELANGNADFRNGIDDYDNENVDLHHVNNDMGDAQHGYENHGDELVDEQPALEDDENMNVQASNNVEQNIGNDYGNQNDLVNEENEDEADVDLSNVSESVDKKRRRKKDDESTFETVDVLDGQPNKKMVAMNPTKEI